MSTDLATLARLTNEINARFLKAAQYDREVAEMTIVQRKKADDHRIAAGLLLIDARKLVDGGAAGDVTWIKWCSQNIDRSRQDICKVMKIAGSSIRKRRSQKNAQRLVGTWQNTGHGRKMSLTKAM